MKARWGELTDDDLAEIAGKLQDRYRYTKDRARQEIVDWVTSLEDAAEGVMAPDHSAGADQKTY